MVSPRAAFQQEALDLLIRLRDFYQDPARNWRETETTARRGQLTIVFADLVGLTCGVFHGVAAAASRPDISDLSLPPELATLALQCQNLHSRCFEATGEIRAA